MAQTVTFDEEQKQGYYADVVQFLHSYGRDEYGAAAMAAYRIIKKSDEFKEYVKSKKNSESKK